MRAAIFVGPTLSRDPVLQRREYQWLPPAMCGDVYRIARTRPDAIALVDGCFETQRSVWHKEILWALSRGIHVFGAASMGALRAAELDAFGMRGVGGIYRAYKSGALTDDDEVAVVHAPQELGWQPLTEALVDMRATLSAAVGNRVISPRVSAAILAEAKATYFKDRTWDHVLARVQRARLARGEFGRLARWLPNNRVERKRRDARALIRALDRFAAAAPGRHRPGFTFANTAFWQTVIIESRR